MLFYIKRMIIFGPIVLLFILAGISARETTRIKSPFLAGAEEIIEDCQALGWSTETIYGDYDFTTISRPNGAIRVILVHSGNFIRTITILNKLDGQTIFDSELLDYLESVIPSPALAAYQKMIMDTIDKKIVIRQIALTENLRVTTYQKEGIHFVVFEDRRFPRLDHDEAKEKPPANKKTANIGRFLFTPSMFG